MMRVVFLFCLLGVAFLAGCSSEQSESSKIKVPYKQVGYHPGAKPIFGTYFVYVNLTGVDTYLAYRDLKKIAQLLCKGKNVCFVHFWDEEEKAGHSIPISDSEANSIIASYNINRDTGNDEFLCHPFADPFLRCATMTPEERADIELAKLDPKNYSIQQFKLYKQKVDYYSKEEEKSRQAGKRKEKIESQFSAWDGSHRNLERVIKKMMHNPKSYEHVETVYWDRGDHLVVKTTFRGTNAFGAVVTNSTRAKVSMEGQVLEILN